MTYQLIENLDNDFDQDLKRAYAHFTQSSLYRKFQTTRGLKVKNFTITKDAEPMVFFQLIIAPLFGGKTQIYIPHGPVLLRGSWSVDLISFFKTSLTALAKRSRAVFVRFDSTDNLFSQFFSSAPRFAYHTVLTQPRFEWVTTLPSTSEDLVNQFSKDLRYSIRTAKGKGVEIEIVKKDLVGQLDIFYSLLKEAAERNHFHLHPKNYYQQILVETEKADQGLLVIAKFEGETLVVNLLVGFGDTVLHLFGGSTHLHKDKLPSYLAHSAGMEEAIHQGFKYYSFGGIAYGDHLEPTWKDLTAFKRKFPGEAKDFGKLYDLKVAPIWYYIYTIYKLWR